MKLRAIRVRHVRQFGARGAALDGLADGVNVLAAANEAGKTTLFDALKTALFAKHSSRKSEVRSLITEPHGEAPVVEIDLDTASGRFRLQKRFIQAARAAVLDRDTGRPVATGDAVDAWLEGVLGTSDRDGGATGLLWVDQGASLSRPADGAADLASLLETEIGAVVGGERSRAVLARATAAREELVSGKLGRPRRDYEAALRERDRLEADVAELRRRALAAEEALERIRTIDEALLERGPTLIAELDEQLAGARRRLVRAEADAERLAALEREHRAVVAVEAHLQAELDALGSAQTAAAIDLERLDELERRRAAAVEEADRAAAAAVTAGRFRDGARDAFERARSTRQEAERMAGAALAAQRLQATEHRLDEAWAVTKERAAIASKLTDIRVTPEAIEALERDGDRMRVASARLAAARPTLRVTYAHGAAGRVRMDGRELADGADLSVEHPLVLELDGIGALAVRPGGDGPSSAAAEAEAAGTAFHETLERVGARDLGDARAQLDSARSWRRRQEELGRELARLAPDGIEALRLEVETLRARAVDETTAEPDLEGAAEAERKAMQAADRARDQWQESLAAAGAARERKVMAEAALTGCRERVEQAISRLGPRTAWPQRRDAAMRALERARLDVETARQALERGSRDADDRAAADAEVRRLDQAVANHRQETERLRVERAGLVGELRAAEAEGVGERLAERLDELDVWTRKAQAYGDEVAALDLLIETLGASEAALRERLTAPVLAVTRPLLRQVLPDAELELGDDFGPRSLARPAGRHALERLSGGTREQLAILCRLGYATLMARRGRPLPVILDDALVFSDDARIERMFTALTLAGDEVQLLVLTCRERAFRQLGGRALEAKPWPEAPSER